MKSRQHANHISWYAQLWQLLLDDAVRLSPSRELSVALAGTVNADWAHLKARSEAEGYPFLCGSLPALSDMLLRALETGYAEPVEGFGCAPRAAYPNFLRAWWKVIFSDGGVLRFYPGHPSTIDRWSREPSDDQVYVVQTILRLTRIFLLV